MTTFVPMFVSARRVTPAYLAALPVGGTFTVGAGPLSVAYKILQAAVDGGLNAQFRVVQLTRGGTMEVTRVR